MADEKKPGIKFKLRSVGTSPNELKGMQSVRATFKLSEKTIGAISIVATQLGIKQKSLFDHLMEDTEALSAIARRIEDGHHPVRERVQKTYVMSRKTLSCLEQISQAYNAPRDVLIEYSVDRLMPIIDREREKHELRKKLLEKVRAHFEAGRSIMENVQAVIGEDDPMMEKLSVAMSVYESALGDIENFIRKGRLMEDF